MQAAFFESDYWADPGEEMGLEEREWKGLQRVHAGHLRRLGGDIDRRRELETALEVREVVVGR